MSKTKHTPGPWNLVSNHNTIAIQKGPNGALRKDAQPIVAWPGFDSAHFSHEVNFANAKLISAAPDLAGALVSCSGLLVILRGNRDPIANEAIEMANAALRKAGVLP